MRNVNLATKRTSFNIGAAAGVVGGLCYMAEQLTGWKAPELDLKMLAPLAPVVGIVGGIVYRLSRAITDKFPGVGWIIFGSKKEPVAFDDTSKRE